MITWIKNNYPEYSNEIIIELPPDRRQDEMFYKATHDFVYDKLHADIVKAFICGTKIKEISEDGTEIYYSFGYLREFEDNLLFGARRAKTCLPDNYLVAMDSFINSLKKENKSAKNG